MTKNYRELVALRVKFYKADQRYRLVHYYRVVMPAQRSSPIELTGYDMDCEEPPEDITQALRNAYAPALISVWKNDSLASFSELLQFQPGSRPDEIGLPGEWSVWKEVG